MMSTFEDSRQETELNSEREPKLSQDLKQELNRELNAELASDPPSDTITELPSDMDAQLDETKLAAKNCPKTYGELIPLGGGDPIPLLKSTLVIGRRESCDIVLRFPAVSSKHTLLTFQNGYWFAKDMDSLNFTKINGSPISEEYLAPGDILSIARYKYEIDYHPSELGATSPPPIDGAEEIFSQSLLERAGLERKKRKS